MASLVLLRNPLTPALREVHPLEAGDLVIDWLVKHYPAGFGMPVKFYVNGEERPADDLDYKVHEDDVVVIALMPAEPVSLTTIGVSLLLSAALAAASYFVQRAFAPKQQSGKKGDAVSVYDVASDQNAARIGDPIPVIYGTVITTPDYVAQPYTVYDWLPYNYDALYNGIQYLDLLLCVGQGYVNVTDVYVGDTAAKTLGNNVVTWQLLYPFQHANTPGMVSSIFGGAYYENVVTSPEVGNQEFSNAGDEAGWFTTCKPGQSGSEIEIDIVYPSGLFDVDGGSNAGDLVGRNSSFTVYYQEVDDSDTRFGTEYSQTIFMSTKSGTTIDGRFFKQQIVTTSTTARNKTAIGSPIRRSYRLNLGRAARWAVKLVRTSSAPNAKNGTDRFIWAGLKLYAAVSQATCFDNVTLLAVRIKASQGMNNDASVRIRVKASRYLTSVNGSTFAQTTSGPAAFVDAYTDATYGAARPRSEVDITRLNELNSTFGSYQFNHVFRERITVWEALRTILTPFAGEPLPVGGLMSAVRDGVKSTRVALFTEANIIAGSMTVGYGFFNQDAADGVEIEYLDPKDWRPVYTRYPTTSLQPERYSVPGISSATHAAQYARLIWQRLQLQRKNISFDTELEGLILQLGDRIGIAHNSVLWGDSGLIISQSGNTLTVDHKLNWSGGTKQIILRGPDGAPSSALTVTRGGADNKVVLPSSSPVTIHYDDAYEYTSFTFGSSSTLVKDFLVTSVKPNGDNTVTIEAVNYDASVYTGAMTYMAA